MKNSKFRNVHGWTFLNDGTRAAAQRIISAMDGGAYMQHRVCYNKLEVQKYTRTYIFERTSALFSSNSLYLNRLFPKKIITKGKQQNFFTNNQLSHKTRKKIFRSVCFLYRQVLYGLGLIQSN